MTRNPHAGDSILERAMHIEVNGDSIYVKLLLHRSPETREQSPTLLFLHEALGSVGQWKSFPKELCQATGCDGVVYDRIGHGQSSPMHKPRDLHFYQEEAEVVLPALLSALNIRRPLLLGHSDGATIALKFASSFPEAAVGVVSMAAHVIIEDITLDGIRDAQRLYTETDLRAKLTRYHGDKTDAVFSAWAGTWLQPGMKKWNMLDDLRLITCPVLIIQGERDAYGSRAQVDAIAEHVHGKHEILWLKDCGHVPHLEERQAVIASVCRFVEDARSRE
ncbi:MAG: alpha/beta hydrolase [Bacteroidia bacterium]|nr:alpha/beta hydrolase [Bacteroidia bacterium]